VQSKLVVVPPSVTEHVPRFSQHSVSFSVCEHTSVAQCTAAWAAKFCSPSAAVANFFFSSAAQATSSQLCLCLQHMSSSVAKEQCVVAHRMSAPMVILSAGQLSVEHLALVSQQCAESVP
jgi:hypothetical protein